MRGLLTYILILLLILSTTYAGDRKSDISAGMEGDSVPYEYSANNAQNNSVVNPMGVHDVEKVRLGVIYPATEGIAAGYRVAAGDFNGDGFKDLAYSAIYDSHGNHYAGAVFLMLGPIPEGGFDLSSTPPDLVIYGGIEDGKIGESLLFADLNGDGREELIIGAPSTLVAGVIYIIKGGEPSDFGGRIDLPPVYEGGSQPLTFTEMYGERVLAIWGNSGGEENYLLGWDLARGDVNGDGITDLIFSQPFGRSVHVLWGNGTWPPETVMSIVPVDSEEMFGYSLLSMDIDSDGIDDIIIGSPYYGDGGSEIGAVYVFYGNTSFRMSSTLNTTMANITITGSLNGMHFGADLTYLRVRGGKYPVMAISAPGDMDDEGKRVGSVYLVRGRDRGYFERHQSVEDVYFRKVMGDQKEAPLKRVTSFDSDFDGGDDLVLLRPYYRVNGVMLGEAVIIYSRSLYTSGEKTSEIPDLETHRIRGVEGRDSCGSDAALINHRIYLGSPGADGQNNTLANSGEIEILPTSHVRISGCEVSGFYTVGDERVVVPRRPITLKTTLYSSRGAENITSLQVQVKQTEGWSGHVTLNWTPYGGLAVEGPEGLLNGSLLGVSKTTPEEITLTMRMYFTFLWPSAGRLIFEISAWGVGECVLDVLQTQPRLIRELWWREENLTVSSGGRDLSMNGIYVAAGSPVKIKGPLPTFRELPDVIPDLRNFRAALKYPGGEVFTTFHEGFTFTVSSPPTDGEYRFETSLVWAGPPPSINDPNALPPPPPPLTFTLHVVASQLPPPENLTVSGGAGGGKVAYSRDGEFTLKWSGEWSEASCSSLGVSMVGVRAVGKSYSADFTLLSSGGLKGIFFPGANFTGRPYVVPQVSLPADWGVLGPDPENLDPASFSALFTGAILVEERETYTVGIKSDTHAILDLDYKTLLVSSGGNKATALITLEKGYHPVSIWYQHVGEGESYLDLLLSPAYMPLSSVNPEVICHPSDQGTVQLDAGTWEVSVWGMNPLGMQGGTSKVTAVVDRNPPSITRVDGPSWYTTRPQVVSFIVEDDFAGVDQSSVEWSLSLDGSTWGDYTSSGVEITPVNGSSGNYLVNLTLSLPDGITNYVRLRAKDLVGNGYTHSGSYQIKVDTQAPTITVVSPTPGSVVRGSAVTVHFNLSDQLSGLDPASLRVYVEGEGWRGIPVDFPRGTRSAQVSFTVNLREGNNTLRFSVGDVAGNVRESGEVTFVQGALTENMPPRAVITSPVNGSRYMQGTLVTFDGRASTDDGRGPYRELRYSWVSNISGLIGTEALFERSLPAGRHLITLYVDDGQYNSTATVVIEIVPPPGGHHGGEGGPPAGEGEGTMGTDVAALVLLGVAILGAAVFLYMRYRETGGEQAVIPMGPEE